MFLFENAPIAIDIADVLKIGGTAILTGFIAWLFGRKKSNSDVEKNESEIIQNYVNIIAALQSDIDGFIVKLKGLRGEMEVIEDAKKRADKLIEAVKQIDAENVEALHKAFKIERAKLAETVVKLQMVVSNIIKAIDDDPTFTPLRMEVIRTAEMLHYLKTRLQA